MKKVIQGFKPFLQNTAAQLKKIVRKRKVPFLNSAQYWEDRYKTGGTSGAGSYGRLAIFKAEVINDFIKRHSIQTIIEHGSGDGNQLTLMNYPDYLGLDVSVTAIEHCRKKFQDDKSKRFIEAKDYNGEKADLSLSLDVIYHLIEDQVFHDYLTDLFRSSDRHVIIYASNTDQDSPAKHVKHRAFAKWVEEHQPAFRLIEHIPNKYPYDPASSGETSISDFYIYEKI